MRRALLFLWWRMFPPLSIRVARRMWNELAQVRPHGNGFLRFHWKSLSADEREFLDREGMTP